MSATAPLIWQDEGGASYWASGHHAPDVMVAAILRFLVEDCGLEADDLDDYTAELCPRAVRHLWYREDHEVADRMRSCAPSDHGAKPFTVVAL